MIVFTGFAPVPESIIARTERAWRPTLELVKTLGSELAAVGDYRATEDTPFLPRLMNAITLVLNDHMSLVGLDHLGIDPTPRFAVYNLGLSLVVRLELASGTKLKKTLARFEYYSGWRAQQKQMEHIDYRLWSLDFGIELAVAVIGDELVFVALSASADTGTLKQAFGIDMPTVSIADTGVMRELARTYGFGPHVIGYLDLAAIAAALGGPDSRSFQMSLARMGIAFEPEKCRDELASLSRSFPRVVTGTQRIDGNAVRALTVVEMAPELAADLRTLQTPIPNYRLFASSDAPVAVALGIDGARVAEVVQRLRTLLTTGRPPQSQCPGLGALDSVIAATDPARGTTFLELFEQVRAFSVFFEKLKQGDDATTARGHAVIDVHDLQALGALLRVEQPEWSWLAQLASDTGTELLPVGEALEQQLGNVQLAWRPGRIALALNDPERARALLDAESTTPSDLLAMLRFMQHGDDLSADVDIMPLKAWFTLSGLPTDDRFMKGDLLLGLYLHERGLIYSGMRRYVQPLEP